MSGFDSTVPAPKLAQPLAMPDSDHKKLSLRTSRVTRDDVARHAQVSTAVVSYVINNGPRAVAPETRRRVEQAIAALGYFPNTIARSSLATSRSLAQSTTR